MTGSSRPGLADTETTCHCGAEYRGFDHCPACGCEQYESLACPGPDDSGRMCKAISMPGAMITVHTPRGPVFAMGRPGLDFICTQDPDHKGGHKADDGHGHILARWPRAEGEQTWTYGHCALHNHQVGQ